VTETVDRVPAAGVAMTTVWLAYLIGLIPTHGRIDEPIGFVVGALCLLGLFVPEFVDDARFWGLLAAALAVNLFWSYSQSANHYYLSVYTTGIFAITAGFRARQRDLPFNLPRVMLTVVIGFAVLHKFLSSYFVSGRLLATYFLRGNSLSNALSFLYPDWAEVVAQYRDVFDNVADEALPSLASASLDFVPDSFFLFCQAVTICVLVIEVAVLLGLVITKLFRHAVFELTVLGFVWGTAGFRNEYFFLAQVCILTLLAKPDMGPARKTAYIASITLLLALGLSELSVSF